MEILEKRLATFLKAFATLEETLSRFNTQKLVHEDEVRDSLIQRFEYCADIFWKLLKDFLRVVRGIDVEIARPKSVINECAVINFLSQDEYKACLQIIDDRNITSHAYDQEVACDVAGRIPIHFKLMKTVLLRIQEQMVKK